MRHNDAQDELVDGFEPSPLPPVSPDGALELPPLREAPRHAPRLCEQGPCRNYHTFQLQLDAQRPMAVRGENGQLETPEAKHHVETHHYCYPSVGIETKLGALPVIKCNRWSPISAMEAAETERHIDGWFESESGRAYKAELEAYLDEQKRLDDELASAIGDAAADLANMEAASGGSVLRCHLTFELRDDQGVHPMLPAVFEWTNTLAEVRSHVLANAAIPLEQHADWRIFHVRPNATDKYKWTHELAPEQTISQVGLSSGDLVMFDHQPIKETA